MVINNNNNEENLRPKVEVRMMNFPSLYRIMEEVSRFIFLHIFWMKKIRPSKGNKIAQVQSNGRPLLCFPLEAHGRLGLAWLGLAWFAFTFTKP
jgi:hypothetical protein